MSPRTSSLLFSLEPLSLVNRGPHKSVLRGVCSLAVYTAVTCSLQKTESLIFILWCVSMSLNDHDMSVENEVIQQRKNNDLLSEQIQQATNRWSSLSLALCLFPPPPPLPRTKKKKNKIKFKKKNRMKFHVSCHTWSRRWFTQNVEPCFRWKKKINVSFSRVMVSALRVNITYFSLSSISSMTSSKVSNIFWINGHDSFLFSGWP